MTRGAALRRDYAPILARYVAARDEAALSAGYELGRRAFADGVGVLDLLELHYDAERALLDESPPDARPRVLDAARTFSRELLSPYEMALRGYREANAELRRLNDTLVRQKEAVVAANGELEAFSYSVSHDLRAPLRSLDGFSQALLEDYGDALDEDGKRYLRYIRESAQEMAKLIDDMLALSRVSRAELTCTRVDVSALAERILSRLRAAEPARTVEVVIEPGLVAFADARLFGAAMENLLGNAWKFTRKRARARIEVGRDGGAFFVKDNGAGFDPKYAAKLFQAFQRLHTTQEFEGTGVGLATVRRIVARHGGRVWAEGEPDVGATFHFSLAEGS
jgi:light-regulated signal transduction histidine kinase (bacteriophytochrome)